jgi:hypothetical protein
VLLFFCGLRRAMRGSLRSYLRRRFASAWYAPSARRYYPSREKIKTKN